MLNKRILFLTAVMVAVVGAVAIGGAAAQQAPTESEYSNLISNTDGDGTEADPHVITNVSELQAINASLDFHYVLGNDIDASETENWNDGSGFDPLGGWNSTSGVPSANFTGTFDGQGYSISGLHIDRTGGEPVGLFLGFEASQDTTDISNIGMEVDINGSAKTGGLVGYGSGNISVSSIDISGNISGAKRTGGVIGYTTGNVTGVSDVKIENVSGGDTVGGVIGGTYDDVNFGSVSNVNGVTVGHVFGTDFGVGGISGYPGSVSNISDVTVGGVSGADTQVGGVTGYSTGLANINGVTVGDISGANGRIGGVGGNVGGNISDINNIKVGDVSGTFYVGGVGGYIPGGNISDISDVTVGNVSGSEDVGGIGGGVTYSGGNGGGVTNINNIETNGISGTNGVGGISGFAEGPISNVTNVEISYVSGTGNVGGVGGDITDNADGGDVNDVSGIIVSSLDGNYTVASSGGNISNSIIISDSATFQSSSSANNSVIFADTINGDLNSSYTNSSWYDADGNPTDVQSFRESTADDTWEQDIGNLETAPIVPELSKDVQFELFNPEITDGVGVVVESGAPGEEVTGQVQIDTGTDATVDFPVTVEMTPDSYNRIVQDTVTIDGDGEYDFSFNTSERDFGNHTMVATVGETQVIQEFELTESGLVGGDDDTTFSTFEIPGTDISVPLLPVGGILVVGLLGAGYIYYREEEIDFQ